MTKKTEAFSKRIANDPKAAIVGGVLVANAFIWFLYSQHFLTYVTDIGGLSEYVISAMRTTSVVGTMAAALLGVYLVFQVKKRITFLKYWMLAGVFLSLIPLAIDITNVASSVAFFTATGMYFGVGMPVALAYFAASTETGNRAKLGGITFFLSFVIVVLLSIFATGITLYVVIMSGCKAFGLIIVMAAKPDEKIIVAKDVVSYASILKNKSFLLYLIPWIMFIAINYTTLPLVNEIFGDNNFTYFELISNVLAGALAVAFGFLADRIGRKRLVVSGFALLGLGYASLGLFSGNSFGWYFYTVVDGVAWGAFYSIFLMTIWGDLAQGRSSEKYYAIGFLPFLFSAVMPLADALVSTVIMSSAVFSFASVFLFVAVLPLASAPETLNLKDREFKSYVEKAVRARLLVDTED